VKNCALTLPRSLFVHSCPRKVAALAKREWEHRVHTVLLARREQQCARPGPRYAWAKKFLPHGTWLHCSRVMQSCRQQNYEGAPRTIVTHRNAQRIHNDELHKRGLSQDFAVDSQRTFIGRRSRQNQDVASSTAPTMRACGGTRSELSDTLRGGGRRWGGLRAGATHSETTRAWRPDARALTRQVQCLCFCSN